ncbi:MAG TPA: HD domain-containing protein [Verrucomicrobiales bacterium]|nr:HD domain-containing protein [Verrucomicrobiales bacterium]
MERMTLLELERRAAAGPVEAILRVQLEAVRSRLTKQDKDYLELEFTDGEGRLQLRIWADHPLHAEATKLRERDFLELGGRWTFRDPFGLEPGRLTLRPLAEEEKDAFLQGPAGLRERQDADYRSIQEYVSGMRDPRLAGLASRFLTEYGERFRRTAAAREFHHARRGGLVEHVAQMLRSADALCGVYTSIHRDLLLAGVLFHDCGKLWENSCEKDGFAMPYQEVGELIGHIACGMELVNRLWRDLEEAGDLERWKEWVPGNDDVRLHLLHLIAAHHGTQEFGSPVVPRTPEAMLLHFVDNIDAKMEMMSEGYARGRKLAPRIFQRVRPLPANLVAALGQGVAPQGEISPAGREETGPPEE